MPRAITLRDARVFSRIIAFAIKKETFSRSELAAALDLSRSAVDIKLDFLLKFKLLMQGKLLDSTGGRAPREVRLNQNAGYVLVIEMGATEGLIGISDLAGNVLESSNVNFDISDGPQKILRAMQAVINKIISKHGNKLWGIGIGLPGPVEYASGMLIAPPIMPGWDRFPVREYLEEKYKVPVWVDNEVNLMALGESRAGAGREMHSIVYIKIGTGIGGGLVYKGQLLHGESGSAGDIGHLKANSESTIVCRCGKRGCLEALAGAPAILHEALRIAKNNESNYLSTALKSKKNIDIELLAQAILAGDSKSIQIANDAGGLIGSAIAQILFLFNPSKVIIGGRVSALGNELLSSIRRTVYEEASALSTRNLSIEISNISHEVGLKGAGYMVLEELIKPERLLLWLKSESPFGKPEISAVQTEQ
jgi:glucokinase-like ROK family protein